MESEANNFALSLIQRGKSGDLESLISALRNGQNVDRYMYTLLNPELVPHGSRFPDAYTAMTGVFFRSFTFSQEFVKSLSFDIDPYMIGHATPVLFYKADDAAGTKTYLQMNDAQIGTSQANATSLADPFLDPYQVYSHYRLIAGSIQIAVDSGSPYGSISCGVHPRTMWESTYKPPKADLTRETLITMNLAENFKSVAADVGNIASALNAATALLNGAITNAGCRQKFHKFELQSFGYYFESTFERGLRMIIPPEMDNPLESPATVCARLRLGLHGTLTNPIVRGTDKPLASIKCFFWYEGLPFPHIAPFLDLSRPVQDYEARSRAAKLRYGMEAGAHQERA